MPLRRWDEVVPQPRPFLVARCADGLRPRTTIATIEGSFPRCQRCSLSRSVTREVATESDVSELCGTPVNTRMLTKPLVAILSIFALTPSTSTSASPERFYSGAEWVLDSEGEIPASSAILLDRNADLPHAQIENNIQRAVPDRRERALTDEQLAALLPHTSTQQISVIGQTRAPTRLRGEAHEADDARASPRSFADPCCCRARSFGTRTVSSRST